MAVGEGVSLKNIASILESKKPSILELEKFLYQNPEIEMEEFAAKAKMTAMLRKEGFTVDVDIPGLPTAFVAHKSNGNGPAIGVLAEYDALPGIGHACGHNLIGAMGYGAAVVLAEMLEQYHGSVWLFGCPAEETGRGKPALLSAGYFKNVDVAMMAHPMRFTGLASNLTNLEGYDITYHGRASHAGEAPDKGINALDAAVIFYTSVGVMRQQLRDDARVHAIITDGGKSPNVIPDTATVRIEIRQEDTVYFRSLVERILIAAKAAATASGCTVDIEMFEPPICCMKNNKPMLDLFKKHLQEAGVPTEQIVEYFKTGGCSDMGNVSQEVPSIHPWIHMVRSDSEAHTSEFLEDADAPFAIEQMYMAIRCLAGTALDILRKPDLLEKIYSDFKKN